MFLMFSAVYFCYEGINVQHQLSLPPVKPEVIYFFFKLVQLDQQSFHLLSQ